MFINISNHPSDKWLPEQLLAARGEIIDFPFPVIDPYANAGQVREKAHDVLRDIAVRKGVATWDDVVAHVMGEQGFCFVLVGLLKERGATVVHSTTVRATVEHPDGSKTAQFRFVQFREY